jgi:hypothetical protein
MGQKHAPAGQKRMVFLVLCSTLGLSFGSFRSSAETRCYRPRENDNYSASLSRVGREFQATVRGENESAS